MRPSRPSSAFAPARSLRHRVLRLVAVPTLIVGMLGSVSGIANAAPAAPNVVKTFSQPDGTALRLRLWGDEFAHGWETLSGHTVLRNVDTGTWEYATRAPFGHLVPSGTPVDGSKPPVAPHVRPSDEVINLARAELGAPPIGVPYLLAPPVWAGGDTDVLFIMVEFSDRGCTFTPAQMQDNMFGNTATGPGNLQDYYDEISSGNLDVQGTVVGNADNSDCVALPETHAFYDTGAGSIDQLVDEAVALVDPHVDFSTYDNDGNGQVDALGIIYAGGGPHDGCDTDNAPDGGDGDDLWPHSGGTGGTGTADSVTADRYIVNSEITRPANSNACTVIQTIGLFAHEFGHSLGLPDLYDTDDSNGDSEGVGAWSTMASQYRSTVNLADTPPHFDPWSKWFLDWVNPSDQTGVDAVLNLTQVETSAQVMRFLDNPGGAERNASGEYFLVENRQLVGFDSALPGCGTVIWHIDETRNGNQDETRKLVDVEEADGNNDLDNEVNRGDQGDPFPGTSGNHVFSGSTSPNSDLYDGSESGVRVRVQDNACAATMQLSVGPNQPPVADVGGPYVTPEGSAVMLSALGSTDPDADPLTFAWDLDDNGTFEAAGSDVSFLRGDNGAYPVCVRVSDPDGASNVACGVVTVTNVLPTVTIDPAQITELDEGESIQVQASFTDPGWLDTYTGSVNPGDTEAVIAVPAAAMVTTEGGPGTLDSGIVTATITYGDNGLYNVTLGVTDDDGGADSDGVAVTAANLDPTAEIDLAGAIDVNGVQTIIAEAGQDVPFSGRSTDEGSDDLGTAWDWDDGAPSPDEVGFSLVNPPFPDGPQSPTVQARDITDSTSHAFSQACMYQVGFAAIDDDLGDASDSAAVLISGTADRRRSDGWWHLQYKAMGEKSNPAFDEATLACYLEIARFASDVFDEQVPLTTLQDAHEVLHPGGTARSMLQRELLTALLNFANGAVGYQQMVVDTDKDGSLDTAFGNAVAAAESVALNGSATVAELHQQRQLIHQINVPSS